MLKTARLSLMLMALAWMLAASPASAAPRVGEPPPDYAGKQVDGTPVLLSQYAGKAVVISFWATWCPYCMKELPILNNIQAVVGKDRLQVIAVNVEEREVFRKVERALRSLDLQLAYDPDQKGRKGFGVGPIPHMAIIGRDGKIVAIYEGYSEDELGAIVDALNRAVGAKPDEAAGAKESLQADSAQKITP